MVFLAFELHLHWLEGFWLHFLSGCLIKNLKIMYELKNLETNETKQFETMEAVAQWFNFFEDIYEDGVWDKFIELHPSYEFKWVEDDKNVDKNVPLKNKEDEDDLVF